MLQKLMQLKEYYVITFPNTQTALKAEKMLEEAGKEFLLIPTPREVSASCGLALKFGEKNKEPIVLLLEKEAVPYSGVYFLKKPAQK